ncbi:unnamed protein product [Alopecurus aequalis]
MAAALPPRPHDAAATETCVCILWNEPCDAYPKPRDQPCSIRLHGDLIMSHGTRGAVTVRALDHRVEVADVAAFMWVEVCSQLILDLLEEALAHIPGDCWMDVDSTHTPLDIAEAIAEYIRDEFDGDMGVPIPSLDLEFRVTVSYSEPKPLLPAYNEAAVETEARGRKRRREPGDELCPICLLDVETEEDETVTLPCSHPFHRSCIATWFHQASTCPTCRREILDRFSFVRSASDLQSCDDESEYESCESESSDEESEDEPSEVDEHHT